MLSGNGNTVGLFIDYANNDAGEGARVVTSRLLYGGAWEAPIQRMFSEGSTLRRLPSAVRTVGNECLLGFGYDNVGASMWDDTNAYTLYWDGSSIPSMNPVNLSPATDNPIYSQQVAFDPSMSTMYYLYFDNHMEGELDGGDLFVISAYYPSDWSEAYETRVVNASASQRPSQGYLFRGNGGDLLLIYALEEGPPLNPASNTLRLRYDPGLGGLEYSTDTILENYVSVITDNNSRYRTVYAAQDTSGNIHVVWQDASWNVKWRKINSTTHELGVEYTVCLYRWLDSISVGSDKLYVSVIDPTTLDGSIIEVTF